MFEVIKRGLYYGRCGSVTLFVVIVAVRVRSCGKQGTDCNGPYSTFGGHVYRTQHVFCGLTVVNVN